MAELSTIARPYAKAAFEAARDNSALAKWSEALALLAAIAQEEQAKRLFSSPSLTAEQKRDALISVCESELDEKQKNFIGILAHNNRLSLLPEIALMFELYKANQEKSVEVSLESAFDISDSELAALESGLKKTLARDVSCQATVNKDLVGGVLIRAGDTVIDASIRGRLAKLADAMSA
jgi:F-type H+-transporting ATPase subunit delta